MIDASFLFSQHSLGDFADCPRRFYLRYIAKQEWPLIEAPQAGLGDALAYREYLRKGAVLHQWIERFWLGLATPDAAIAAEDDEMRLWWARFLASDFSALPPLRLPELALVAPLGRYRLYARFDLLAHGDADANLAIVDWKTLRGERAAAKSFLGKRLQTRAYLYVLATAGAPFNEGRAPDPERCTMRYWLANFPDAPWVTIDYSPRELEQDRAKLSALVDDIASRTTPAAFELTTDVRQCAACTYRTLCKRDGAAPVDAGDLDDEPRIDDLSESQSLEY
jgi:hypothetical protein